MEISRKRKFDHSFQIEAMNYAAAGLSNGEIAKSMGISISNLHYYFKKYALFKANIERMRARYMRDMIEHKFTLLAAGVETEEVTEEYIEMRQYGDNDPIPVKITRKKRTLPPDAKSLRILANKYLPETFGEKDVNPQTLIDLKINNADRVLSMQERLEILKAESKKKDIEIRQVDCD